MNRKLTFDTSSASHSPLRRRVTMGALAAIGAATIALAGVVNATPASVTGIILLVGADESQRVVNWYASANTQQVVALVTASHLGQQFLVVGAQLPEPTVNVTAAIWRGASSRGREVPNTALSFDPDAFTPEHAGAAIRAGVASVLSDVTGIVIRLD